MEEPEILFNLSNLTKEYTKLPFIILVAGNGQMKAAERLYSENGSPYYDMRFSKENLLLEPEQAFEFNYRFCCEMFKIRNEKDLDEFMSTYPNFRLLYGFDKEPAAISIHTFETMDSYRKIVLECIKVYHLIREFVSLLYEYRKQESDDGLDKILSVYSELYPFLNRGGYSKTFNALYRRFYAQSVRSIEVNQDTRLVEKALKEALIGFKTDQQSDKMYSSFSNIDTEWMIDRLSEWDDIATKKARSSCFSKAVEDVEAYINSITKRANIRFDAGNMLLVSLCPDMLTAMYLMIYVALYDDKEFLECSRKRCHCYFVIEKKKLEKPNSRTLCDRHNEMRNANTRNYRKRAAQKDEGII